MLWDRQWRRVRTALSAVHHLEVNYISNPLWLTEAKLVISSCSVVSWSLLYRCHSLPKLPTIVSRTVMVLFLLLTVSLLQFNRLNCLLSTLATTKCRWGHPEPELWVWHMYGDDTPPSPCDSIQVLMLRLGDSAKQWGSQLWAPDSFECRNTALTVLKWMDAFSVSHAWGQHHAVPHISLIFCTITSD